MYYLQLTGFIFLTALAITFIIAIACYWFIKSNNRKKNANAEYEDPHIGI